MGVLTMNSNIPREIQWIFCPIIGDRVRVDVVCRECSDWDGVRCNYTRRTNMRMGRASAFRPRSRKPRSGGGVRVPPVWEKWPASGYGGESSELKFGGDKEADYGAPDPEVEIEESGGEPEEEYDPDYHDPFLFDTPENPGEPEIEVIDAPGEPAAPGTMPGNADGARDPFSEPFPRLPESVLESRDPFAEPFPTLPEGTPESRDPFSELPGQTKPDVEPGPRGRSGEMG